MPIRTPPKPTYEELEAEVHRLRVERANRLADVERVVAWMNDPKRKEAIHAGKSILRHFRYHGDKYDPVQVASLPRDTQGNCIPDVSGMKMTRFTRQEKLKYQMAMGQTRVVMQGNGGSIIEVKE